MQFKNENDKIVSIERSIRRHQVTGLLVSVTFALGFGIWASTTHISGAVVTSGNFVVASYAKKIQHPTGGIVSEILVHEGSKVNAGDVVMRLDETKAKANLKIVTQKLDEAQASVARLLAERDGKDEPNFPGDLVTRTNDPKIAEILQEERRLFEIRQNSLKSKISQLTERIAQYESEITGTQIQEQSLSRGIKFMNEQISIISDLAAKGLASNERLTGLKTQLTSFDIAHADKIASVAQTSGKILEAKAQMLQITQDFKAEVGANLREARAQIAENEEKRIAAEDEMRRLEIISPVSGIVHELAIHTIGGVINAGEVAMQVIPNNDTLEIEASIPPKDIDHIYVSQPAVIKLPAFNQRTTPELNGTISRVGADLVRDDRTGLGHYVVRISVPEKETLKIPNIHLIPGMPAEAFISTGSRSVLSYLLKPLMDQIDRAFREY